MSKKPNVQKALKNILVRKYDSMSKLNPNNKYPQHTSSKDITQNEAKELDNNSFTKFKDNLSKSSNFDSKHLLTKSNLSSNKAIIAKNVKISQQETINTTANTLLSSNKNESFINPDLFIKDKTKNLFLQNLEQNKF